jgi:hypothetical protein
VSLFSLWEALGAHMSAEGLAAGQYAVIIVFGAAFISYTVLEAVRLRVLLKVSSSLSPSGGVGQKLSALSYSPHA